MDEDILETLFNLRELREMEYEKLLATEEEHEVPLSTRLEIVGTANDDEDFMTCDRCRLVHTQEEEHVCDQERQFLSESRADWRTDLRFKTRAKRRLDVSSSTLLLDEVEGISYIRPIARRIIETLKLKGTETNLTQLLHQCPEYVSACNKLRFLHQQRRAYLPDAITYTTYLFLTFMLKIWYTD